MKTFVLHFVFDCTLPERTKEVRGRTIAEAISNSDLDPQYYHCIDSYEVDGERHEICAQANCNCWYHAEQGLSCMHDLELIGLTADV